jgi:single-stranded-DNA-specific exonuclease
MSELAPAACLHVLPPVHPLLVQLLWNRQIREPGEILSFLDAEALPLASPFEMQGMTQAVARILRAIQDREIVAVYGDYDVDGLTGTALVVECLRALGVEPVTYLPRRDHEGYGLNQAAIERLRERGVSLIITVDCGISAAAEVEHASKAGVDVVITDHHHVPPVIPRAVAILNPNQPGCQYPFKALCGVGLAYRLAQALLESGGQDPVIADQWLDLVAVGTVADVVSLTSENRRLVARGLQLLNPPVRPGLLALVDRAGLGQRRVTPGSIGFGLAPRLNAAGRLDDATVSLRLLLTHSPSEADELAWELDVANRERQRLTTEAVALARSEIQRCGEERGVELPRLIVVAHERYRQGIAGLVAAKLVEEYGRPALVAEVGAEQLRGSARSISGFHVTEALARCDDLLERFGGHAMAAGFTVTPDHFSELRHRLELIGRDEISDEDLVPRIKVDAALNLRKFDQNLPNLLERLEPFGCDNPRPVFLSRRVRVLDRRVVGHDAPGHLKLKLADAQTRWDAIGFRLASRLAGVAEFVDIVYCVERDDWNGRHGAQLRLLDFQASTAQS